MENCCSNGTEGNMTLHADSTPDSSFPTLFVTTVIVHSIIFIVGLIANVCAIVSIAKYSRKGCGSNLYLLNLAISDLALLMFGLPLELRDIITAYYPYSLPDFLCPGRAFLMELSGNVSALTIAAFSIQRWLAICFPLKPRAAYTFSRTLKVVVGTWLVASAGAAPIMLSVKINRLSLQSGEHTGEDINDSSVVTIISEYCALDIGSPKLEMAMIYYSLIATFVVPLALIIALNLHIGITIQKTGILHSVMFSQRKEIAQRKSAVRMLGAVATAFFICWFPFHMQRLLSVHDVRKWSKWIEEHNALLYFVSGYLYYANAVVNPLLYTLLSQRIRKGILGSLRSLIGKSHSFQLATDDYTHSPSNQTANSSAMFSFRKSMVSMIAIAFVAGRNPRVSTKARSLRYCSYPTARTSVRTLERTKGRRLLSLPAHL